MLPGPTARLRFREYREDDAAQVFEMFADEDAQRFFSTVDSLEAAGRWAAWMQQRSRDHGHSLWVLESLEDGRFIGDTGVLLQEVEGKPLLEVGYHLPARERGKGHALEAARACLSFAFDELGAEEVGSLVHPDNEASVRVASRLHASERNVRWRDSSYRLFFTLR
jgi:RimJ/RimL family protein N-acetyltransferase